MKSKQTPHETLLEAPHHINPDQRITVSQAAALLGIGRSTAWAMIKDGRLPKPERYGRCTRLRYGDLFP